MSLKGIKGANETPQEILEYVTQIIESLNKSQQSSNIEIYKTHKLAKSTDHIVFEVTIDDVTQHFVLFNTTETFAILPPREEETLHEINLMEIPNICQAKLFFLLLLQRLNANFEGKHILLKEHGLPERPDYNDSTFLRQIEIPFCKTLAFINEFESYFIELMIKNTSPSTWNLYPKHTFNNVFVDEECLTFERRCFLISSSGDFYQTGPIVMLPFVPPLEYVEYHFNTSKVSDVIQFFHEAYNTIFEIFPFCVTYEQEVSWIINFVHVIASGMESKGNFADFLKVGIYDPRLLLLITSFLKEEDDSLKKRNESDDNSSECSSECSETTVKI